MNKMNKLFMFSLLPMLFLSSCSPRQDIPGGYNPNNKLVTSVTLDVSGEINMEIGETLTATPTITFVNDEEVEVTKLWKTSRPNVASVDNGFVVGLGVGKTTISFIAGYKMAFFNVVIEDGGVLPPTPPVDEFSLSITPTNKTIDVDETFSVEVTVNHPELVDDPSYTLQSDNPSVASVNDSGLVTGLKGGTAHIIASSNGKTATCTVNVNEYERDYDCEIYFFIDYNNIDEEDDTGTKLVKTFEWYTDRPLSESGQVPANPTNALDPAFPYFIGWSSHTIIDTKEDLWDMEHDVVGSAHFLYLYGIWSDVPAGSYNI